MVWNQYWFVLLREVSCNFVDRVLTIRSHTSHEITLSYMKEHEIRVFVQSLSARESQTDLAEERKRFPSATFAKTSAPSAFNSYDISAKFSHPGSVRSPTVREGYAAFARAGF
jgi:hypothetical protein